MTTKDERPVVRRWHEAWFEMPEYRALFDEHNALHDYTLGLERQLAEALMALRAYGRVYQDQDATTDADLILAKTKTSLSFCSGDFPCEASTTAAFMEREMNDLREERDQALREKAEAEGDRAAAAHNMAVAEQRATEAEAARDAAQRAYEGVAEAKSLTQKALLQHMARIDTLREALRAYVVEPVGTPPGGPGHCFLCGYHWRGIETHVADCLASPIAELNK